MSGETAASIDRSIDYLFVRSTDAFLSDTERARHTRDLVAAIDAQLEVPESVFRLLAHRMLSPEQREAMNTLEILNELVTQGGNKVAREVGKYKFLNNFIRLLSNKYQGTQTSPEVRMRAVALLFGWRESLRAQTKIREVYDLLRAQRVIVADPPPSCRITASRASSATRLAAFEDREKARVLAELLKSKRADDLRAANRMIKGMVRAEDQRVAKFHKQKEVLNAASSRAELLWNMLENARNECALLDNKLKDDAPLSLFRQKIVTMKELHDALLAFRPMLFRYASEAATCEVTDYDATNISADHVGNCRLAEILTLNDRVNLVVQLFQERFGAQYLEEKIIDESDGNTDQLLNFMSPHVYEELGHCSSESLTTPFCDDVEILGSSITCHSLQNNDNNALSLNATQQFDEIKLENSLLDLDLQVDQQSHIPKTSAKSKEQPSGEFLLQDVDISATDLDICGDEAPIVFLQENRLQAILYRARLRETSNWPRDMHCTLITLSSANVTPFVDIELSMTATNMLMTSRLIPPSNKDLTKGGERLAGFQPGQLLDARNYVFLLLPLTRDCSQATIAFSLCYSISNSTRQHADGSFVLTLAAPTTNQPKN